MWMQIERLPLLAGCLFFSDRMCRRIRERQIVWLEMHLYACVISFRRVVCVRCVSWEGFWMTSFLWSLSGAMFQSVTQLSVLLIITHVFLYSVCVFLCCTMRTRTHEEEDEERWFAASPSKAWHHYYKAEKNPPWARGDQSLWKWQSAILDVWRWLYVRPRHKLLLETKSELSDLFLEISWWRKRFYANIKCSKKKIVQFRWSFFLTCRLNVRTSV